MNSQFLLLIWTSTWVENLHWRFKKHWETECIIVSSLGCCQEIWIRNPDKGREVTTYRPLHLNLLSSTHKPLFLQPLCLMGFPDFVTHHKDKPEWERVLGTWSKLHVRNSSTFEFQDWNIFRKKWASDMARGRALDEGAIPCGWLFGFSFSFSLVRLLNN